MTLTWTRERDGAYNGKPCYEYTAESGPRTYHIVWACDRGGTFGFTAITKDAAGGVVYLTERNGIRWQGSLGSCKAECERIEAHAIATRKPAVPLLIMPVIAGSYETFDDWVNKASHTIAERFCPKDTVGYPLRAICVDAKGRRCQCGGDFMRARDEAAFPVVYFWEFKHEPTF